MPGLCDPGKCHLRLMTRTLGSMLNLKVVSGETYNGEQSGWKGMRIFMAWILIWAHDLLASDTWAHFLTPPFLSWLICKVRIKIVYPPIECL